MIYVTCAVFVYLHYKGFESSKKTYSSIMAILYKFWKSLGTEPDHIHIPFFEFNMCGCFTNYAIFRKWYGGYDFKLSTINTHMSAIHDYCKQNITFIYLHA